MDRRLANDRDDDKDHRQKNSARRKSGTHRTAQQPAMVAWQNQMSKVCHCALQIVCICRFLFADFHRHEFPWVSNFRPAMGRV